MFANFIRTNHFLMATVLITGGTGLIGTALSQYLKEKGYTVMILSRQIGMQSSDQSVQFLMWNPKKNLIDERAIKESDYIIHLAGAGIADKRWTKKRKKEILNSRKLSAEFIVQSLQKIPNKVRAVVAASGIGWYIPSSNLDSRKPDFRSETDPPDSGFLGETCRIWEESIGPVRSMGKRLVIYRTGLVLSRAGGAFPSFYRAAKFGLAPMLSSGRQIMSWIHIDDLCRLYEEALKNEMLEGVYNAVAPNPISNSDLTIGLAKLLRGNFFLSFHVPAFLLNILFGGVSIELLKSVQVNAGKIRRAGFQFLFPSIDAAIKQLCQR